MGILPIVRFGFQLVWSCPREARSDWLSGYIAQPIRIFKRPVEALLSTLAAAVASGNEGQSEAWMYYCNFPFLLWRAKLATCLLTFLSLKTRRNNLKAIVENSVKICILWGKLHEMTCHSSPRLRIPGPGAALPLTPSEVPQPWGRGLHLTPPLFFFSPLLFWNYRIEFWKSLSAKTFKNIFCMCYCQTGIDLPNKRTVEICRVRSIFIENPTNIKRLPLSS